MIKVPDRILNLKAYVAGKTIEEVKRIYDVDRVSKLASNENRLGCSPQVEKVVNEALKSIQDYPDPVSRRLKKEISKKNSVNEDQVMVAAGSESVLSVLCRTFLNGGDNIVTADATFVGIFVQAGVMGSEVRKVPVTENYAYDPDGLLEAIDENTKMVYLANPNNPTGTYISRKKYKEFLEKVPDDVLIIADEAYFEYSVSIDDYPSTLDYLKKNVVITRTFSKAFGLAGFRIGYAVGDSDIISQLMKARLTFEPTAPAQAAALAAYRDEEFLKKSIELVKEERHKLYSFFDEKNVDYVQSISNSVMMIADGEREAADITHKMLEKGVILRHLSLFGLPHCIRVTIGTTAEMDHFKESFISIKA